MWSHRAFSRCSWVHHLTLPGAGPMFYIFSFQKRTIQSWESDWRVSKRNHGSVPGSVSNHYISGWIGNYEYRNSPISNNQQVRIHHESPLFSLPKFFHMNYSVWLFQYVCLFLKKKMLDELKAARGRACIAEMIPTCIFILKESLECACCSGEKYQGIFSKDWPMTPGCRGLIWFCHLIPIHSGSITNFICLGDKKQI